MEKILTISVAAYNVEQYLQQCLESCIVQDKMDALEVIIVNDGSTDNTLEVAREYERKFPNTFIVIDKENGGYGSTVNASMKTATGKYIRLLDGDDWLNTEGLSNLLDYLEDANEDWIISDYVKADAITGKSVSIAAPECYRGKSFLISDIDDRVIPSMWCSTFSRSISERHRFELPHHCLYTDALFVTNHLPYIEKMHYIEKPLYCYRMNAREEQSTSKVSRIRHSQEEIDVYYAILRIAVEQGSNISGAMKRRVHTSEINVINTVMCCNASKENMQRIKQADQALRHSSSILSEYTKRHSKILRGLRISNYYAYWLLKLLSWPR